MTNSLYKTKNHIFHKRNYGIDLLRMFAMFMVVILHILGHGGILTAATGAKSHVVWFIEIIAYCAVDCFVIISGYVSYNDNNISYKYSKFLGFWLSIIIYNVGFTLLAYLINPLGKDVINILKTFLPVTTGAYWYVSAYAGLFFVKPWLNKLIQSCDKKESTRLIILILTVYVAYVSFANYWNDCFKFLNGYSFIWLIMLYLIGAWLKKCNIPHIVNDSILTIISAICLISTWLVHEFISNRMSNVFVNYTSITIVIFAISLVSIFSKFKINDKFSKLIACFSPAVFGVYLIHCQSHVMAHFIRGKFVWIADLPILLIPLIILGIALGIFVICLLIEKVRLQLFEFLKINNFINYLEKKLDTIILTITNKIISKIK